ncbi:regulator of G-protein signaling loco isoform X4 [Culex pipiens pallens]|uniref:regulator of G-protein signaling loco isoform X4 n=1 Tax=Culex pipiens pallens TaxID=42434 RepID=UPI001954BC05|nr:regulator of G-protein signaling loco isoform X4 [Culex pipiens pallens]
MADGTLPNERGGTEEAPSSVTTTKTSEITIIMKTLVSNTTTTTTTSKAAKKCECNCGGSADGSTIEVTTSVRSVFECPAGCNKAALLEPILASNFMTLLKTANDSSSFENVLEFKSLLGPPVQPVLKTSRENLLGGGDNSQDVRKFLSDLGQHNASVCCKTSRDDSATSCCVNNNNEGERSCLEKNNISVIESVAKDSKHCLSSSSESDTAGAGTDSAVFKKPKICDDMKSVRFTVSRVVEESGEFAAKLPSSTPIKRSGSEDYKLNLLTPPADASFIDSDFESMEQDQYDTCSSKESLKLEDTCLCVRKEPKEVEPFNPEELFPEPTHVRETLQTPARVRKTSSTKAFFEEALKTPLALRKRFQKRRSSEIPKQHSHSNLLQFFSSRKKSTSLDGVQRPVQAKRSITSDNSSDTSRCASPTLTEENLRRLSNAVRIADLSNRTLVWGENFDYSFECEPSHSDVEEEDEPEDPDDPVATRLVQFNISPDSSFEMQPPIVPTFKIDPPQAINIASELAQGLIVESCMKRSVSDPIRLKARSLSCTPLTSDIGESEEDEEEVPIMKEAAHVHFHSVHEASLRSLDKIGNKQINPNASPFRRWGQSSLRSRSGEQRTPSSAHRRPSSLAASESDVYTKSIDDDYSSTKSGYNPYADVAGSTVATAESAQTQTTVSSGPAGVASWGTSFEKLLEDPAGLHTFSEFLKKEFSAENIYFWTACERYRQLVDREERAKEAQAIFAKHLESGCSEPVNVDSIARNIAQENLPQAEQTLFGAASKQIFNLMKFDSYQRFIKSDMYRACQEAEAKGHPLPYPGDLLDPLLRTSFAVQGAATKLKKSLSNAEDRRRKSLLPWHRKTRCKSKDRGDAELKKEGGGGGGKSTLSTGGSGGGGGNGTGGSSNTLKVLSTNSTSDIHSSRSSLASFDAAIGKSYDQEDQTRNTLCRVILSNGATTVVQTRSNETIKELVERLLEKRGIVYTAYEAFLAGNHKPLDLDGPSSSLAGREVNIDQRVVFKLSLPNRKMISVKSKATKPLGDVLRPILLKYNYELDQMNVYSKEAYLDMTYPVTSVDGLWLQVRNGNENDFHQDLTRTIASRSERAYANQVPPLPIIATSQHAQIINHFQQQLQHSQHNGFLNNNNVTKKSQLAYGSQSHHNLKGKDEQPADAAAGGKQELNMLDEITNKVFNELMNGKIANGPKVPPEDCTSDSSSTRRGDRFRRRGSNAPSESGRCAKSKKCSTAGSEDGGESVGNAVTGVKKPIIAKLKAGVKLQIPTRSQNDELLEGLKRAQRSRLEDQRGTEINFELPDFLKDKENFTSTTTTTAATSSAATAMAAPSSKFTRKFAKRPESAEFPLGASTNGGSLQQIHKPQPAPRLSISRGAATATAGNPSSPPVQSASSESNLNNLSLRCNASPLTLDDNGNGSQSENSYAEATMIFTHASANPHHSPGSSPPSSHRYHHLDGSSAAVDHHHYEAIDGSSAADLVDGGVIYHPPYHRHPHQHHNHNQQQQHRLSASTSSGSSTGSSSSSSGSTSSSSSDADNQKGPPPLPPKPKILPIKPSNWGHSSGMSASMCNLPTAASGGGGGSSSSQNGVCGSNINNSVSSNISGKEKRLSGADQKQVQQTRSVYLDHASSSFV